MPGFLRRAARIVCWFRQGPRGGRATSRMAATASDYFRGNWMSYDNRQFYIDGAWVDPVEPKEFKVINPATETIAGVISMGQPADVDRAVAAARRAFDGYSRTAPAERLALMERILAAYKAHYDEIAQA